MEANIGPGRGEEELKWVKTEVRERTEDSAGKIRSNKLSNWADG